MEPMAQPLFREDAPARIAPTPRINFFPSTTKHPFFVRAFLDSGTWKYEVTSGTVNGVVPTALTGTLGTGNRWVYIKFTFTLSSTADGAVYTWSLATPAIEVKTAAETTPYGPSTSVFYDLLANFTADGVKAGQQRINSLTCAVDDNGTLDSKGMLEVTT